MKNLGIFLAGSAVGALLSNEKSRKFISKKAKEVKNSIYDFFIEEVEEENKD